MYLASHGTRNLCVAAVVGALALGGTGVALASSPGTGAASSPQKLATASTVRTSGWTVRRSGWTGCVRASTARRR